MNHKSLLILLVLIMSALSMNINAQPYTNGFSKAVSGAVWVENNFRLQADTSLLVRCINAGDKIEWETAVVPDGYNDETVTYIWIGGYSSSTNPEPHSFTLSVNDDKSITFLTASRQQEDEWTEKSGSIELKFKKIKINSYTDGMKDIWGYFFLTIPKNEISPGNKTLIKISGDGTGSKHWFITLQQPMLADVVISPEKIVNKDGDDNPFQRIKVTVQHFGGPATAKIFLDGKEVETADLKFGINDIYIRSDAVKSPVSKNVKVEIEGKISEQQVTVTPVKQLTFYIIPHAHVDIGYTALQTECEKRHWDNFDTAIKLAEASKDYPKGSVFKWSPEVLWAVESYLETFPDKRERLIDAIKKGWINLDATYANSLTGLSTPEELYRWVERAQKIEKETGVKIESAMITDIPGYTWGVVQAFADNGIKYFSVGSNPFDRIGWTLKEWGDKPFYWKSPSGENRILVWLAGKGYAWFHGWKLTDGVTTPLQKYIEELEKTNYPYEMVHLRYNIGGDNGYPDSLLSDYVKKWNEEHVTPKFVISSSMEMFTEFEKRYGSKLPEYSGDFTPYWEDGASSTAKETAINRNTSELLNQLEILYTLSGKPYPYKEFEEAWKYVLLFTEHTWGAFNSTSDPEIEFVTGQWDIKKSYGLIADSLAKKLYSNLVDIGNATEEPTKNFTVYNSSSWKRSDVVTIPATVKTVAEFIIDEDGKETACQRLTTGELIFIARDVPAMGSKQFKFSNISLNGPDGAYTVTILKDLKEKDFLSVSNDYFKINADDQSGTFSVSSKSEDVNYKNLNSFIHTGRAAVNPVSNGPVKITKKENGSVATSLLIDSDAPGCNKLLREVRIYNGLNKIDIINTIDKTKNYEKENLRFGFPFDVKDPKTRMDIAWAVIEPEKDQLKGANKNYFTLQRWADVSDNKRGVTLAVPDAPLLEVGGMNAEAWITGTDEQHWATKAAPSSLLYSWVMNNTWHTNFKASQEGLTSFRYSLNLHGKFDYLQAYKFGVEQSQPLIAVYSKNPLKQFVKLDGKTNAVITAILPSKDNKSYIIRLYNPTKELTSAKLTFNKKGKFKLYNSNGKEETLSEIKGDMKLKPFAVKTIRINPK